MKTRLPFTSVRRISLIMIILLNLVISNNSFSQIVPELSFNSPSLKSGIAGENGAVYLFANVAAGIDAEVTIMGRSSSAVVLSSIDTTGAGLGYPKAFQPVIGIPGVAPANTSWSMDFELSFYKSGSAARLTIPEFYATGIDIDGDGGSLYEWARMKKVSRIDTTIVNSLNIVKTAAAGDGDDYNVTGVVANAAGIDTAATFVMANYRFLNKNRIQFTIGASTIGSTTTAGMRLNSIWFRQFNNPILPLKMLEFTAALKERKVELKWVTTAEQNVSHFEVERSLDGVSFSTAGIVFASDKAEGLNYYAMIDVPGEQVANVIYYRVRSVDIDGKSQLSETRVIRMTSQSALTLQTYPNPVKSELYITVPQAWQNKQVQYELYGANGLVVVRKITIGNNPNESLQVGTQAPGFYILKATCGNQTAQQKIIKQ
jgi:hypothetical protein